MLEHCAISAIVTAYRRIPATLETIARLQACKPCPAEIIVHVDGNEVECAEEIRKRFPAIDVHLSVANVGPGGARNLLIHRARNDLVASFDDDSYPIDEDYFRRISEVAAQVPTAAILNAAVVHRGEKVPPAERSGRWVSTFSGGACTYRRTAFLATTGYVPLPIAYGMEEVDLALRLHGAGWRIFQTPWLRVFHDTDLSHHTSPGITSASIANVALHAFLRYPIRYWALGAGQVLSRVAWLLRVGRHRGIAAGMLSIPGHLLRHRQYRATVTTATVRASRQPRRSDDRVAF